MAAGRHASRPVSTACCLEGSLALRGSGAGRPVLSFPGQEPLNEGYGGGGAERPSGQK